MVGETRVRGLYSRTAANGTPRAAPQTTESFPLSRSISVLTGFLDPSLALSKSTLRSFGGLEVDQHFVSFCLLRRSLMPVAGAVQPEALASSAFRLLLLMSAVFVQEKTCACKFQEDNSPREVVRQEWIEWCFLQVNQSCLWLKGVYCMVLCMHFIVFLASHLAHCCV